MKNDPIQITRKKTKIIPVETAETLHLSDEETQLLSAIADVLEYPTEDWFETYEECKRLSLLDDRPANEHFSEFCLGINGLSLTELQELYTRTFDLNPVCALEIGYHLFGEDYKRGEFLANLRETENPYELGQDFQLPDYLPVVLRLLGQMEDAGLRANLLGYCLLPALKKMNGEFKKKENPFRKVIAFLEGVLDDIAKKSIVENEKVSNARYQYA